MDKVLNLEVPSNASMHDAHTTAATSTNDYSENDDLGVANATHSDSDSPIFEKHPSAEVDPANQRSDAGRPATDEEIKSLRHVTDRIPLRVWLVAVIAAAERFTYWSTQVTWQNFIQYGPDDEIPGVLGLGQTTGVTINNAFNVVVYLLPILMGPIADGRLGRYRTLQICSAFYLVGMGILLACSTPAAVKAGAALPGFIVSLVLTGIGLGGVQTVTTPLIADQYDEKVARITYTRSGERVVIDRDMTIHYVYSIYYWMANAASLGMIPTSLMEKYVSFWSAYTLTTGVLLISILILWIGKPYFGKPVPATLEQGIVTLEKYKRSLQTIFPSSPSTMRNHHASGVSGALYRCHIRVQA
jgi:proton-dependent oligopeptide transporter, POT family